MKNDKNEILKSISGSLSNSENPELKEKIGRSAELEKFQSNFLENIAEMKEIYNAFPNQHYFNNLSNSIISKTEKSYETKFQPSFAYTFVTAFIIFIASQLVNFNTTDSGAEYSELMNALDIEEYFSINESSELNYFSEIIDSDMELDYTSYLFSNSQESYMYGTLPENEIINSLNNNYQEEIYNEIINKKIL